MIVPIYKVQRFLFYLNHNPTIVFIPNMNWTMQYLDIQQIEVKLPHNPPFIAEMNIFKYKVFHDLHSHGGDHATNSKLIFTYDILKL